MIRCKSCGADNRQGVKFCTVCGQRLPAPPAPIPPPAQYPVQRASLHPMRQPQPPIAVPQPLAAPAPADPRAVAEGRIIEEPQLRDDKAPFDLARMLMLASLILIMGVALIVGCGGIVTASAGVAGIAWFFGLVGLGCVGTVIFMMLSLIVRPLINGVMVMFRVLLGWVRGDPTVSALDFRVFDEPTQQAVNVLLYRQPGKGGMVNLGDRVRVYGKSEGRSRIIRAHKVHVYESGGHRADYTIEAMKPWPIWLGALVLGGTVAGLLYALWQMGIMFN